MRVVLATWGSRGDVEPLAALAVRLQEQGAQVGLAAPPDDEFRALLDRAGVELIPLGPTVKSIVAREKPPTAQDAFRLAATLVAARFDTLLPAAEGCDAIVASGLMPSGVRSVADKLGIHYRLAALQVFGLPSRHFPPGRRPGTPSPADETDLQTLWKQDADRVNAMYAEPENTHRAALGLPPIDNVRDYAFTDQVWLAADPILCPWADKTELDVVQTGAWILPDGRPLPDDLESFLDNGEPPVYVGFGSMALHTVPEIAKVVIDSVRAQGRRIVLARGWARLAQIDDEDDCFVVGDVSQQALFPRVAAVVHHGGAGTTMTTAVAGAPQVVVPQIADQPHWAARVAELGIGVAHDGPTPTFDSLSAALRIALAPPTRERARTVAGELRTDGAAVAAKMLIEEVAATRRP